MPEAGIPPAISAAAFSATALASSGSAGNSSNEAAGPSGSTATSFRRSLAAFPPAPAMIWLARLTTCGVER